MSILLDERRIALWVLNVPQAGRDEPHEQAAVAKLGLYAPRKLACRPSRGRISRNAILLVSHSRRCQELENFIEACFDEHSSVSIVGMKHATWS